jgi:hypothetical protein
MPSQYAQALDTVEQFLHHLGAFGQALDTLRSMPVPSPGDGITIDRLLDVRQRLGAPWPNTSLTPPADAAQDLKHRLLQRAEAAEFQVSRAVAAVDRVIDAAARQGHDAGRVIVVSDFGRLSYQPVPQPDGRPVHWLLGEINSLAPGHPLRTVLPADDYYRTASGEPALVLGPGTGGDPRDGKALTYYPWLHLASSLDATRRWATAQRAAEQTRLADEQRQRQAEAESYRFSPGGQAAARARREAQQAREEAARLREELAALKAGLKTDGA